MVYYVLSTVYLVHSLRTLKKKSLLLLLFIFSITDAININRYNYY